jgi:hypothetical protein
MKAGEFKEGDCVLRAKIDMKSSFMCMRDPTLYRIRFETHHQTKIIGVFIQCMTLLTVSEMPLRSYSLYMYSRISR